MEEEEEEVEEGEEEDDEDEDEDEEDGEEDGEEDDNAPLPAVPNKVSKTVTKQGGVKWTTTGAAVTRLRHCKATNRPSQVAVSRIAVHLNFRAVQHARPGGVFVVHNPFLLVVHVTSS